MKLTRYCEISDINWGTLPDLDSRLNRLGVKVNSVSVELSQYPNKYEYNSLVDSVNHVKKFGAPKYFNIWVHGLFKDGQFRLNVFRNSNIHSEEFLCVTIEGSTVHEILESVIEYFGLKPDVPPVLSPKPPRTAFIGHRFDSSGVDFADKVARFLELLGFRVVTGRSFSPKSISEKVRAMVDAQHLLFIILTPGSDDTWLIQESIFGDIKGKPIFILKENSAIFKPGLFADMEYIPFNSSNIETCFIPILEGLRDLGYLADNS
jgi:hypothetical protein